MAVFFMSDPKRSPCRNFKKLQINVRILHGIETGIAAAAYFIPIKFHLHSSKAAFAEISDQFSHVCFWEAPPSGTGFHYCSDKKAVLSWPFAPRPWLLHC